MYFMIDVGCEDMRIRQVYQSDSLVPARAAVPYSCLMDPILCTSSPRRIGGRRLALILSLAGTAVLSALSGATAGRAASASVSNVYMAGGNNPTDVHTVHFDSHVPYVDFNYTVDTPSVDDSGEVDVYVSNTNSSPLVISPVNLLASGPNYVPLYPPNGDSWNDGAYCTVFRINGVPQTNSGVGPIAWTVGQGQTLPQCNSPAPYAAPDLTATAMVFVNAATSTPISVTNTPTATPVTPTSTSVVATDTPTQTPSTPTPTATVVPVRTALVPPPPPPGAAATATATATSTPTPLPTATSTSTPTPTPAPTNLTQESPKHFVLSVSSQLRAGVFADAHFYTRGTHGRAIGGITIALDGHKLGMRPNIRGKTDRYGYVLFHNLRPIRTGFLKITASKSGYATVIIALDIRR